MSVQSNKVLGILRLYTRTTHTRGRLAKKETIMSILNEKALSSLADVDEADKAYCLKLSKHLENMGLSAGMASSAIAALADGDNVPTFIPCAATPSQFSAGNAAKPAAQKAAGFEEAVVAA